MEAGDESVDGGEDGDGDGTHLGSCVSFLRAGLYIFVAIHAEDVCRLVPHTSARGRPAAVNINATLSEDPRPRALARRGGGRR